MKLIPSLILRLYEIIPPKSEPSTKRILLLGTNHSIKLDKFPSFIKEAASTSDMLIGEIGRQFL